MPTAEDLTPMAEYFTPTVEYIMPTAEYFTPTAEYLTYSLNMTGYQMQKTCSKTTPSMLHQADVSRSVSSLGMYLGHNFFLESRNLQGVLADSELQGHIGHASSPCLGPLAELAPLQHLQQHGREGDELPHCPAQACEGSDAPQAKGEVAGGRYQAHGAQQDLRQGVHQRAQVLRTSTQVMQISRPGDTNLNKQGQKEGGEGGDGVEGRCKEQWGTSNREVRKVEKAGIACTDKWGQQHSGLCNTRMDC